MACYSCSQHGLPYLWCSGTSGTQSRKVKLLFLDLVDKFYSSECDRRVIETLKAEHGPHALFDSSMILFKHVIYIFARSHDELRWKDPFPLEFLHCLMRSGIAIPRDLLGEFVKLFGAVDR